MEGLVANAEFVRVVAEALGSRNFTLLDIGCSGGIDFAWRQFGKGLRAFGFDPSLAEIARLNAKEKGGNIEYVPGFVGISPDVQGAERLKSQQFWERMAWARLAVCETLKLRSKKVDLLNEQEKLRLNLWNETQLADVDKPIILERFVEERGIEDVDFVKIDVDGPDYLILQSIVPMLRDKRVLGIGVEVNFFGSENSETNTFHNMDRLLRSIGFELFDLSVRRYSMSALPSRYAHGFPAQSTSGRPFQGDAVYLRDLANPDASIPKVDADPLKLAKLAALFSIIGQPDSAAELLLLHREAFSEYFSVDAGLNALLRQSQPGLNGMSYTEFMNAFHSDDPMFYSAAQ